MTKLFTHTHTHIYIYIYIYIYVREQSNTLKNAQDLHRLGF